MSMTIKAFKTTLIMIKKIIIIKVMWITMKVKEAIRMIIKVTIIMKALEIFSKVN
jgi:hypothetical protein